MIRMIKLFLFFIPIIVMAGEYPNKMCAYWGDKPKLDGMIKPGEYDDATSFRGTSDWMQRFVPTTSKQDLSIRGWVKHDGESLYFAFDVTDDVLYGIDIDRWLPDINPKAHELTREGFPWFGDGVEILMNPRYKWGESDTLHPRGDGGNWQMVCSTHKSRLGGLGKGGLMEGEPRNVYAWNNYQRWILAGAMKAAVRIKDSNKASGYVIEWEIKFNPCLEISPGVFWSPRMGEKRMGLNIAISDMDEKEKGQGNNPFNFHHEDWWAGEKGGVPMQLEQWGTLIISPNRKATMGHN